MTDKPKIIRGAKGSPPPPPQPTRTPDTLHSRQFATFLDLISEGEIEGFASASKEGLTQGTTAYNNAALKDVFLNDTPVPIVYGEIVTGSVVISGAVDTQQVQA